MTLPVLEGGRLHYRRSLASRVTLLTTLAVGLTVAFVAVGAYAVARVSLQQTLDHSLLDRAHAAAKADVLRRLLTDQTDFPFSSAALGAGDVRVSYMYPDGSYLEVRDGITVPLGSQERAVASGDASESMRTAGTSTGRYRVVSVPSPAGGALVLAQSLDSQDHVLSRIGIVTLLLGLLGVIAAAFAGWGVARNGLRPVRRLTEAIEESARTEDLTPLDVKGDDEIARLATAYNGLLASVAAARHRQRQLVADAGHELRTPLTSLRTNLDLLQMADDAGGLPQEARTELLDDVRAQIQELSTLINDLVELARDDPAAAVVEQVDLAEVVERSARRVRLRAPSITLQTALMPWIVEGESSALERAVTNLIDNASKWSPPEGHVEIRLSNGVLTVADHGPGIAPKDLPHVFDRFYRSTESRSMPGSGLGLSIVRQVAERHGGTVKAATGPDGGALLTLRLPGHPPAPPPYRPSGANGASAEDLTFGRPSRQA